MRICFVLPRTESKAIGGYKVVFDYANHLAALGEEVCILFLNTRYLKAYHVPRGMKRAYFDIITSREPRWFPLDSRVQKVSDYSHEVGSVLQSTDIAVATAVSTASYVTSHFETSRKVYFIQGYETWGTPEERVHETYRLGMTNIVISHWLKDIVERESGVPAVLINNPIDTSTYCVTKPIDQRPHYSLAVLYNPNPVKGFSNALRVLLMLKKRYPDLQVNAFGAYKRPRQLPDWVSYKQNATQLETVDIYNSASVFLCSSLDEGYGLTGLESMACGCALSTTDYAAVHEYAVDGVNCLTSPVGDAEAQYINVCKLFDDSELRTSLATNAVDSVGEFAWDVAIRKLYDAVGI